MKSLLPNSIKQLSTCFQKKTLNPTAITQHCLDLADAHSELNAFIRVTKDVAINSSRNSENRYNQNKPLGILDGSTIALKDNFCTNGIHTTCSSKMLKDFVPQYSSTVYTKLEEQGAILIGKTNMDQFGMGSGTVDSLFGPTKNSWSLDLSLDNWRIAGGSSGGSAVSVSLGITFAALGSDTGGSTRNPASYCGVVGLKPTYGLVSRHGLIPLVNSMDVPGILTRTVDDCAVILNAVAGPDIFDSTTLNTPFTKFSLPEPEKLSVKGVKIGIPLEYHCEGLSAEVLETWTKIADILEDAGAEVKQVSLPNTAASITVYSILNQCEVSSNMSRYDGIEYGHRSDENSSTELLYAKSRAAGFNGVVKNRILAGNYFLLSNNYDRYFEKALKIRRLIAKDFDKIFKGEQKVDFLLTPTTLTEAPLYKDFIKTTNRDQCAIQDFCTQNANMSGIPAVSIPIRLSSNKLPLSLQLMGPHLSEERLLTVSKWIEQQVEFPKIH